MSEFQKNIECQVLLAGVREGERRLRRGEGGQKGTERTGEGDKKGTGRGRVRMGTKEVEGQKIYRIHLSL
jgi:hypothetical protein